MESNRGLGTPGSETKGFISHRNNNSWSVSIIMVSGKQRISIISVPEASVSTGRLQISLDTAPHSGNIVGKENLAWGVCHFIAVSR